MISNSRKYAFDIVNEVLFEGAYSNIATDRILRNAKIDPRDKSLATAIGITAIERRLTIDYNLSLYLRQPLKKLKPQVYISLVIGAAQILFMDGIPHSAAVNESVELCVKKGCSFAKGLVNAVLRKISSKGLVLPDENTDDFLSVKYSVSQNFADMLVKNYGKTVSEEFLDSSFRRTDTICRLNTIKTDANGLMTALESDGAAAEFITDTAFILKNGGSVTGLSAFKNGYFFVQDLSSQLCVAALNPKSGDRVLDVCAAPGGKSYSAACLMKSGRIISCDIHEHKLKLISDGATRLGIDFIQTELCDGSDVNVLHPECDCVLCDVPCSGTGVIAKKPEIRYKDFAEFADLPDIQYGILENSARFVKPGGTLVYSTCSIRPEENEKILEKFLAEHRDFVPEKLGIPGAEDCTMITMLPPKFDTDGFFVAKMKKKQ